jgi:hypothetical protein
MSYEAVCHTCKAEKFFGKDYLEDADLICLVCKDELEILNSEMEGPQ